MVMCIWHSDLNEEDNISLEKVFFKMRSETYCKISIWDMKNH